MNPKIYRTKEKREERNRLILEMVEGGNSYTDAAKAFKLSRQMVHSVCKRHGLKSSFANRRIVPNGTYPRDDVAKCRRCNEQFAVRRVARNQKFGYCSDKCRHLLVVMASRTCRICRRPESETGPLMKAGYYVSSAHGRIQQYLCHGCSNKKTSKYRESINAFQRAYYQRRKGIKSKTAKR